MKYGEFAISRYHSNGFLVSLLFLVSLIAPSPVLHVIGITGRWVLLFAFSTAFILITTFRIPVKSYVGGAISISLFFAGLVSLYWGGDLRIAMVPLLWLLSVILVAMASSEDIVSFVKLSTTFLIIIVVGAWIGFFLATSGMPSMMSFRNPDGRVNHLYLTTLTNSRVTLTLIRPAGIYDEPGSFSFFVCAIAAMRHVLDLDKRKTWFLLFAGFITFSLTHLIYVIAHIIIERKNTVFILLIIASMVSIVGVVSLLAPDAINRFFLSRLMLSAEANQVIAGDNRTTLLINAAKMIDFRTAFFGYDAATIAGGLEERRSLGIPGYSANPLTPMAATGILLSWPYYVTIVAYFILSFKNRRNMVALGMLLLFIQRPYIGPNIGYTLVAVLFLRSLLIYNKPRFRSTHRHLERAGT